MSEVASFFGDNQVILEKVMNAAFQVSEDCPFVARFLSQEDRWHIMNICLNRVSALFGPFHVFFNEARRCKSAYRSAWYLYTLTSQQNVHRGRFFVSPYKPVLSWVDRGVKRLRVDLVSEQEMRDIASSTIAPPDWGFFNNRHKQRWELLVRMSELFENQLVILDSNEKNGVEDDSDDVADESPRSPGSWQSVRHQDEVGMASHVSRHISNPRELAAKARRIARKHDVAESKDIDNCIMRVHIPFPSSDTCAPETSSKDVVLFE